MTCCQQASDVNCLVMHATGPCPRSLAACCLDAERNALIVFGGEAGRGVRLNDLFLLDLAAWHWSQPICVGTCPSPRQAPAMCLHGARPFTALGCPCTYQYMHRLALLPMCKVDNALHK